MALYLAPVFLVVFWLYVRWNDARLLVIPERIAKLSKTVTPEFVKEDAKAFFTGPQKDIKSQLPERTGRRYVVVGGGGFLGGWIIHQLLERGEKPANVRVLDLSTKPANYVVEEAIERGLQYIKTDVTSARSVEDGFNHPWEDASSGITVFNTAASIRFYELHPSLLHRSEAVNVEGTRNVVEAAKKAGADVLVYTSSGSVAVKSTRFLLWPWENEPKNFVQAINDETPSPRAHWEHFSNYAVSKREGERLVREADGRGMKTGVIRPGNGVFGPRGDILCEAYLKMGKNFTWVQNSMQSFCYVENCALAHLLYERRLLDLVEGNQKGLPDIGGQAFNIADPGPIPTYGDAHAVFETLTDMKCHFVRFSPTMMFLVAHALGMYYTTQQRVMQALPSFASKAFTMIFPTIRGPIVQLQPSLFYLTSVHLIFDDSRARLPPAKGGLGYEGVWTSLEGMYKTWKQYKLDLKRKEAINGVGLNGAIGRG